MEKQITTWESTLHQSQNMSQKATQKQKTTIRNNAQKTKNTKNKTKTQAPNKRIGLILKHKQHSMRKTGKITDGEANQDTEILQKRNKNAKIPTGKSPQRTPRNIE